MDGTCITVFYKEPVLAVYSNKYRGGLSKVWERAALAFNIALEAILWGVQQSVCQFASLHEF